MDRSRMFGSMCKCTHDSINNDYYEDLDKKVWKKFSIHLWKINH